MNRRSAATNSIAFASFGEKHGARASANRDGHAQRTVCAAHAFPRKPQSVTDSTCTPGG